MKSSPSALAAAVAALSLSALAQVGDGPVPAMTAPPSVYSSSPPSAAVRPMAPAMPRVEARHNVFAAGAIPSATRLTADAREERRFLREAAAQSRFELDASKLALAKSGNSGLRTLAASLINHHNAVGVELTHLLNARGMAAPMISNEQRKTLNQLAKLNGPRFDSVYLQHVGLAQAAVARDYEKASLAVRDPQVSAWIARTLPTTRYHLMLAERSGPGGGAALGAKANRGSARPQLAGTAPSAPRGDPVRRADTHFLGGPPDRQRVE